MLPLEILKGSKNKKILVQIKNGDSINGILDKMDTFMNLKILNAIYTNKEGTKFYKANEIFIRGNNISAINFEEHLLNEINQEKELSLQEKTINEFNNNHLPSKEQNFLNKKRFNNNERGRGNYHNNLRGRGRGARRGK